MAAGLVLLNGHLGRKQEKDQHAGKEKRERISTLHSRYSTIAGHMSDRSHTTRLFGVHALLALADDWADIGDDRQKNVCVGILIDYLRHPMPFTGVGIANADELGERQVRQTIIRAIADRRMLRIEDTGESVLKLDQMVFSKESNLANISLAGCDLSQIRLRGVYLGNADLRGVNFEGCELREANLNNSDLSSACFPLADLQGANMVGANLTDASLLTASVDGATLLDVTYSQTTSWPEGSTPPESSLFIQAGQRQEDVQCQWCGRLHGAQMSQGIRTAAGGGPARSPRPRP
ncbi:pentapeptide repeat-containing protein [Nocardia sp. XZ_19_369]|uniref:pentapeptide repeat-containing protein n=1 Tax=Nocardia sp. XZ_19_369 TaxID=2769487 RepID=UPI00189040A2|nr:pentapeptide repeat-containing protein [Nocardia sp. XZ_19_369]